MAYQPKSYRKFLATSVAAAIVATGAVPAASLAAEGNFKDIEGVKPWAGDAIAYLVEKGAIEGFGNGEFRPNEPLTRGQIAKILAIALDLDIDKNAKTDFPDAKDHWASSYIKAIQDQLPGVINGFPDGTFRPEDPVTREQLAKIVVEAYDLEKDENADINFTDIGGWSKDYIETLASLGIVEGVGGGLFNPTGPVTRAQAAVFVHRTEVEEVRKEVPKKPAAELQVVSVSAINLRQFEVKFNKPVDEDTIDNITVTAVGSANNPGALEYELSDDEKTVTINTQFTLSNKAYYTVFVPKDVRDTNGYQITDYSTSVYVNDTTAPTVVKVESKTKDAETNQVTVEFSEPVEFDLVRVDGKVASALPNTLGNKWTLNSSDNLEAGKTYEVELLGVRDLANNRTDSSIKRTFTVVRDTVKPTFTVNAVNPQTIDVVFDKEMDPDTRAVDSIIVRDKDDNILAQAGLAELRSDKKTFRVTLASTPIASDKTTADVKVTVRDIADTLGNKVDERTVVVTLVKDQVKPTITNVRMIPGTNNQVQVTFSEEVRDIDNTDFVITDSKGDPIGDPSVKTVSANRTDSKNRVTLTIEPLLKSGNYTLALLVNSVEDMSGNKNNGQAVTFSYTAPAAKPLTATIDETNGGGTPTSSALDERKIRVKFAIDGKPVTNAKTQLVNGIDNTTGNYKQGAVDNPANYTIGGKALPDGAVITVSEEDYVTIDLTSPSIDEDKLPKELVDGGKVVVTVSNVKSEEGATLPFTSAEIDVIDKTKPTIETAFLSGNASDGYVLTITFSENMSAVGKEDFELTDGTNTLDLGTVAADAKISDSNEKRATLVITADELKDAGINLASTLTLKTIDSPTATKDKATDANALEANVTGIKIQNLTKN